ncbi:MAG TPA: hypothetical protein VNE38_15220 [Ktedonobacteraceae bacterium]|nr:hypothetical protein [Ktedonobacteraceae bacterium]
MAQLKRSIADDHLYILAGQSQGTWQLTAAGEQWLRTNRYSIPERGESIYLDPGTYHRLKDKNYLFIYHIPYDSHDIFAEPTSETLPAFAGLPILLTVDEQRGGWTLNIDLSMLAEDDGVLNELQRLHPTFVTMNYSPSYLPRVQLYNCSCLLKVWPQPSRYLVQWSNDRQNRFSLSTAPETPALFDNWQGNVFIETKQREDCYHRRLPGSTISLSESFFWLAKVDAKPDWPGKASLFGKPDLGWQLWKLELTSIASVPWEKIEQWFRYRQLKVAQQHYHLGVIGRFDAITDGSWYILQPDHSLLIRCDPPRRQISIDKDAYLLTEPVSNTARRAARSPQSRSDPLPVNYISYFSWKAPGRGDYQIQVTGDACSEPLYIRVTERKAAMPSWLQGLNCTVTVATTSQTFHAFENTHDFQVGENSLNVFSLHELALLDWAIEPIGLPISVTWSYVSAQERYLRESLNSVSTGEELTAYWHEKIWPSIINAHDVTITLDAGNFGLLELLVEPRIEQDKQTPCQSDEQFIAHLVWLSYFVGNVDQRTSSALPDHLRHALNQMATQLIANPALFRALDRLARANSVPTWILYHLQELASENQNVESN